MFPCKWSFCSKDFETMAQLVAHVNQHIDQAQPVQKESLKRSPRPAGLDPNCKARRQKDLEAAEADQVSEHSLESGDEQRGDGEDDDTICQVCGSGEEFQKNLIVLCDSCDLGYHQKCHPSAISDVLLENPDSIWFCYRCTPASGSASTSRRS